MRVLIVGGALLALGGCAKQAATAAAEKVLRLSQRNEPATLDPQLVSLPDEFFVLRALDEGLVTPVPEGVPAPPAGVIPGAAETWETSPDGLAWTFHLRTDSHWSNGDPVVAGDFVYTIRRALLPALAAPKAPLFFVLKNASAFYHGTMADVTQVGAVARDDHTLVLTLEHPVPYLLALIASGPWLPVQARTVEKYGNTRESAWTRPGNFVGNGPFILSEWKPHERITVKRNPDFHGADRVHLDEIRFHIFDDENTEERSFRSGQVDVTMTVPVSRLPAYAPPVLHSQPLAETRYLALNVRRPPLNDPRVRRALALAIDREALVKSVLKGGQMAAFSFIPPGFGGYRPADDATERSAASPTGSERAQSPHSTREGTPLVGDDGSVETARRLLAGAGFPGGRGFPTLEISTWTNTAVVEAVQQMWRSELGIETTIVQREAKVHVAALRAGDYAIGFLPAIPDYGDASALFSQLITGAADNYPHWSNPRYDALVAEAGRTPGPGRRVALDQKAEQLLLAELPVVPLYFNSQNYLVAPRVSDWREDRLWNRFYLDLSLHE